MHLAVSLAGRRALLGALAAAAASCGGRAWASSEAPLSALSDASLGYALVYPEGWAPSPKPVKTHLSESLLKGPAHKAQLGLTVDPVKIDSLEQFGSLQQVRLLPPLPGRGGRQLERSRPPGYRLLRGCLLSRKHATACRRLSCGVRPQRQVSACLARTRRFSLTRLNAFYAHRRWPPPQVAWRRRLFPAIHGVAHSG
eukprot:scaffold53953_cov39-Tisochrysis_lutea.AAC.1